MDNGRIRSLQVGAFVVIILLSTISGLPMTNIFNIAGVDSYFCILVAAVVGIIPVLLILYLANYNEEENLSGLVVSIFGKYFGFVINLILCLFFLVIGIMTSYHVCNFVISQFLSDTPVWIVAGFIAVVVLYNVLQGLEVMSRVNFILVVLILVLFTTSVIPLIPQIELSNFQPILEYGVKKPIWGGILLTLTNIVPMFLILVIPKKKILDKEKYNKAIVGGFYLAGVITFIFVGLTIGVLGIHLSKIYQYPEYMVLKRITLFSFLNRIENLLSIQWIFRCFSMLSFIAYYIVSWKKADEKGKRGKWGTLLAGGACLCFFLGAIFVFPSSTVFINFLLKIYPYINLGLFGCICLIAIGCLVKKKAH